MQHVPHVLFTGQALTHGGARSIKYKLQHKAVVPAANAWGGQGQEGRTPETHQPLTGTVAMDSRKGTISSNSLSDGFSMKDSHGMAFSGWNR